MVEKIDILSSLRDRIPSMDCIPGCTDCCGHTAWSRFEWSLIPEDSRALFDFFSFKCSFCGPDGCRIHKYRPIICRMFGVMEGQPCPRGVKPSEVLPRDMADSIGSGYIKHFFKGESQWLQKQH